MNNNSVTLTRNEVWFSDQKEQVYFVVRFTLARVGPVEARFHADRYVAHDWEKKGDKWTDWRFTCQDNPEGIGPKRRAEMYALVEPVLLQWVNESPEYMAEYQKAVARFIRDAMRDRRSAQGKIMFEKYRSQLSFKAQTHISSAFDHLEAADALLDDLA